MPLEQLGLKMGVAGKQNRARGFFLVHFYYYFGFFLPQRGEVEWPIEVTLKNLTGGLHKIVSQKHKVSKCLCRLNVVQEELQWKLPACSGVAIAVCRF